MRSQLDLELEEIGHRDLRQQLGPLLQRLKKRGAMAAVTNRNRVEAFLVPAEVFDEYAQAHGDLDNLKRVVPLLMAAVLSGSAIPSKTLSSLGIELEFDWRKLNAFQAAFPIRITHDEDGNPITRATAVMTHEPVDESDEELRYIEHE